MNDSRPYLLVKHSTGWDIDRCFRWFADEGLAHRGCYPADGDEFPEPTAHAGVIIFGGAESANDCQAHDWVRRELLFIERCLTSGTPFFGICLGAQMLARVLGARIGRHPRGCEEVGFHTVLPSEGADWFLPQPLSVMQWHSEAFSLAAGAERLAYSADFPEQAFRYGARTFGVQFHPEVNAEALAIWQARNRQRKPDMLSDETRASMMADAHRHDAAVNLWLGRFLAHWTARHPIAAPAADAPDRR